MPDEPRILVAAALAKIIEPLLRQSFGDATIRIAEDQASVERAIRDRLRFDVMIADLTWNDYVVEFSFDGLDVLNDLRNAGRQTPVLFAAQGHGLERNHLDEAVEQPKVVGIYRKATETVALAPHVLTSGPGLTRGPACKILHARTGTGKYPPDCPRLRPVIKFP